MDSQASPETLSSASVSSSSAADKARARRERIQAKLKAQGSSRLNRITATQGSSHLYEDKSPVSSPTPEARSPPSVSISDDQDHDDPPIVLPEHHYSPKSSRPPSAPMPGFDMFGSGMGGGDTGPSEADMRALMAMYGGGAQQQDQKMPDAAGIPDDPMMAILQQMMGGAAGAGPMGAAQPSSDLIQGEERWGLLWKILHALGALMLAIMSLQGAGWGIVYDGSLGERVMATENTTNFFYYFATMELLLQSGRFLLEKGRPPSNSKLAMVGQLLPQPFGMYLITLSRYSIIWTTILNDALMIVFVVGMVSWWNTTNTTVI